MRLSRAILSPKDGTQMGFLRRLLGGGTRYLPEEEMQVISDHYARFFGPPADNVFHELVSDRVHIDVYMIPEVPDREYGVAFTTGMSALPMPGMPPELAFAELFVLLPKSWPMDNRVAQDQETYWPIGNLKMMSRVPTTYKAAIKPGISMPNGDPPENFPGSRFCGSMIGRPDMVDPAFARTQIGKKVVNFYPVVPMMWSEMDWKIQQPSATALLDRYRDMGLDPVTVALTDLNRSPFF